MKFAVVKLKKLIWNHGAASPLSINIHIMTMKKVGIFYGSTTGTTEAVAFKIAKLMGMADGDVHDVASSTPSQLGDYDLLILGTSTWGSGEIEEDWLDFLDGAEELSLKGKKIALFGCGDETMTDTFCNGVGELYSRLKPTGAEFVGRYDTIGYSYARSAAEIDGEIVGLLLDEVNHPELTDLRLRGWTTQLKSGL